MKTYHFNQHYNIFGVALLVLTAISVYIIAYRYNIMGSANIVLILFVFGVFLLGFFTGRPCLIAGKDFFQYRRLPFGRLHLIELQAISAIEIHDKVIKVFCYKDKKPFIISSSSFNREQLPAVTEYFLGLQRCIQDHTTQ